MAFTDVVKIATDANYDSGTEPWSGDPTKRTPSASILAKGIIPKQGLYGQYFNYILNNAQSTIEVIQSMIKYLSTSLSITLDDTTDDFLSNAILFVADAYATEKSSDALTKSIARSQIYSAIANMGISSKLGYDMYTCHYEKANGTHQGYAIFAGESGKIYTYPLHQEIFDTSNFTARTAAGSYTGTFKSIDYSGSLYVLVGTGGCIQTASDGTVWTLQTPPSSYTGDYYQVIYVAGTINLWIAIGSGGAIHTSPDGTTWTARTYPGGTTGDPVSVTYGNSTVVIRTSSTDCITSTNGTSWTRGATVAGGDPTQGGQLAYAHENFYCVAGTSDISASESGTGSTWGTVDMPSNYDFYSEADVAGDLTCVTTDGQNLYAASNTRAIFIKHSLTEEWVAIETEFFSPTQIRVVGDRLIGVGGEKVFISGRLGGTFA